MFFDMRMRFIMTISFFLITDCRNFPSDRLPSKLDQLAGASSSGIRNPSWKGFNFSNDQ